MTDVREALLKEAVVLLSHTKKDGECFEGCSACSLERRIETELSRPASVAEEPCGVLASRLIDAWCADRGKQIPWAKAVQIIAIVTKQSDKERDQLLRMGDEDGSCEMCGRSDARLAAAEGELSESRQREFLHQHQRPGGHAPAGPSAAMLREAAQCLRAAVGAFERNDAVDWSAFERCAESIETYLSQRRER